MLGGGVLARSWYGPSPRIAGYGLAKAQRACRRVLKGGKERLRSPTLADGEASRLCRSKNAGLGTEFAYPRGLSYADSL